MIHTDIPTQAEIVTLATAREPGSISLFMRTSPVPAQNESAPVEFENLAKAALEQLRATHSGAEGRELLAGLTEQINDLLGDAFFWRHLSHSIAAYITPTSLRTYRLPNHLANAVEISDRFHLKPLLRAVTFPHTAFVLALSQNSARLIEVTADAPAHVLDVPNLPTDAIDALAVPSISGRSPNGKIEGSEGKKVRLRQYARAVDKALRPFLTGRNTPLILAATEPLLGIYPSVNSYPALSREVIEGNPDTLTPADLDARVRPILDRYYAERVAAERERFDALVSADRTSTEIDTIARAATFGAVETLVVDIDYILPGTVDEESGAVVLDRGDSPDAYGVIDEVVRRALLSGGRVWAVRAADMPDNTGVAAILRFAPAA
ncbi:hypothetical protein D9V34_17040 [Mycetocola lacteus]|uniref:Uncharacterized protein n=1 Tax=Mycetocola lacteus TaxID=76637 RepID=A0A3L7AGM4_9MICO|nr:hypothetical protein [Mycetocola lacteus]RLP78910.1 hypothetical protein D9V34_17040 [Mycetocola lacteus]